MKRIMNLVVLFLLLFIGQNAWCQNETTLTELESGSLSSTVQWTLYYRDGDEWDRHLSITGTGAIPDYTSITDRPWDSSRQDLNSISIADGITRIGNNAFYGVATYSIDIPSSVTSIGAYAFRSSALKEVYIPSSVTSIGTGAFNDCYNLSLIYYVGRCTANTGIAFSGVAATGFFFEKSGYDTSNAQVPSGWEYYTHNGSINPVTSYVSNGILYVKGKGEYYAQSSSASWYSQRDDITKIVVGDGITNIGARTFEGCSNVTEVTLNNNGSIGYGAFNDCTSLTRVNIGAGVTRLETKNYLGINYYPFRNCSKLAKINVPDFAKFQAISNLEFLTNSSYGTAEEKILMINGSTLSSSSELVISEGVTEIKIEAIKYFKNVAKIKFPSTITNIPEKNFMECNYLTDITIPSTVTSIGNMAFYGCTGLKNATLNNNGNIGNSVFEGCVNLQDVTLNNNGTVGYYAFNNCSSLTCVNIGTGKTGFITAELNRYPFSGCSKLATINISDFKSFNTISNLKYLTNSFYGTVVGKTLMVNGATLDSASKLEIPEGIIYIDPNSIRYFKNVTKIKIPSTVTEIVNDNFSNCEYLTEITLPPTVSKVGDNAFTRCTALQSAILNNTGNIGMGAFSDCTALQTITLNNTGTIDTNAFYNCTSLTRVNIGAGFKGFEEVTSSAFYTYHPFEECSKLKYVNITDFASFNAIKNLNYLTSSNYGTAEEKTLLINGTAHNANDIFYIPEGVKYNVHALRYFSNVKKVSFPSTTTNISSLYFQYATDIILPVSVTSVAEGAFYNCPALERIVCLCPERAPSTTGSIATNPGEITLRVPYTSSATFMHADVWKEFKIEEGPLDYKTYYMKSLEILDLNVSLSEKIVYTYSSNTDGVTVENGVVSSGNYKYDGSRTTPEGGATIIAVSENANSYYITVFVEPREVELTDGYAYKLAEDFEAEKISYTRTFAEKYANHLQCFYVPFDVEVTDELLKNFSFYELYMVSQKDKNGNGEIEEDEPLVMLLNRIPSGKVMQGNMPYFIKPKAASTLTVTAENATLYGAINGTVSCSTTKNEYTLTGVYETTNIKGTYTMASDGTYMYFPNDTYLNPFRWYMSVRNRRGSGEELENYARTIEILIEGEDDTTGIVAIEDKVSNPKNDKVYTVDGRQVTNTNNLPSGIYIVNGKKVFKK